MSDFHFDRKQKALFGKFGESFVEHTITAAGKDRAGRAELRRGAAGLQLHTATCRFAG